MSQRPQMKKVVRLPKMRMGINRPIRSGIKITNVKAIKPVSTANTKQQEEDRLRAQLHKEIEWRSRACAHRGYECTHPVVCGREYCARHILEDASAPYRQCSHNYGSGRKCSLPAPAPSAAHEHQRQPLCYEHARAALAARQRSAAPPPPVTTTETLLTQLQHYVKPERTRTTSCASAVSVVSEPNDQEQLGLPIAVDPFKQIDATAVNLSVSSSIMECASESDSDAESVTLGTGGNCRGGHHEDSSGEEDTPYDRHPLRFAGIFTAEEAVSEAKTAMRLLQGAYLRQMHRLRGLLQTARSQYLRNLKTEKEQHCSISTQVQTGKMSVRERRQLRKLKAYAGSHKRHTVHAILARKLHHKRAKVGEPSTHKPPAQGRCTFTEGGVRCANTIIPASKHCLKHMMHDRHQVLFTECGDIRSGVTCMEPVAKLPSASHACRYHTLPPIYTSFVQKKDESDSDSEVTHTASDVDSQQDTVLVDGIVTGDDI